MHGTCNAVETKDDKFNPSLKATFCNFVTYDFQNLDSLVVSLDSKTYRDNAKECIQLWKDL